MPLVQLIEAFVAASKPVLGICYGHQFIIRTLVGRKHVRRRKKRVWGWLAVAPAKSPIFQGLEHIVAMTCNSDEVFNLPLDYRILAGADHCQVLAYEHRKKPIWGVQFHPEYERKYGSVVLKAIMASADKAGYAYVDERWGDDCLRANAQMFANFLKSQ